MVFFTCNHCGESLKKAAVEKHYQFKACRNGPIFLTCVDCLKDFREQEYVAHIKCISEAERYAAKGTYAAKPDKNKGAQKQEIWTDCIQELSERPNIDKTVRNVLQRIASQSNVPRKKPKFINFLKSSMKYPVHQAEKVWKIIEEGLEEFKKKSAPAQPPAKNHTDVNGNDDAEKPAANGGEDTNEAVANGGEETTTNGTSNEINLGSVLEHATSQELEKSLKKTLKKLKKQTEIPLDAKVPKKKKFIKLCQEKLELDAEISAQVWELISKSMTALSSPSQSNGTVEAVTNGTKKRKNSKTTNDVPAKKSKNENGVAESNGNAANGTDTVFDWQSNILRIFNKNQNDNQLTVDALKSKVIKKFLKGSGEDGTNSEQYSKKFRKQLKKIDNLQIVGDVVQLKA